jgi:hypothetical protein
MKSKNNSTETVIEAEIVPSDSISAVEEFHQAHPEVRRLREEQIREIGGLVGDLRFTFEPLIKEFFTHNAQPIWVAAIKVAEFCDGLPSKELTIDLYRQFVFLDNRGQTISHWLLLELCKLGRKFPNGVDKTFSVTDLWRQLPKLLGDQQDLKLISDPLEPKTKPPQSPYEYFRTLLAKCREEKEEIECQATYFKNNPQFGDFSTLKERRPELHFELEKKLSDILKAKMDEIETIRGILKSMGAKCF